MKNLQRLAVFAIIFFIGIVYSCQSSQQSSNSLLPKITEPTYLSYNNGTEKGYIIEFEIDDTRIRPKAVVLFGVRGTIPSKAINKNSVKTKLIFQSQMIQSFELMRSDLPNGIIFKINDVTYLRNLTFKNKNTLQKL